MYTIVWVPLKLVKKYSILFYTTLVFLSSELRINGFLMCIVINVT